MQASDPSNAQQDSKPSVISFIATVLVVFLLAYVGTQEFLQDPVNQRHVSDKLIEIKSQLCNQGIRLPAISCTADALIHKNAAAANEPLAKQFARLPHLSAVVEKLVWSGGSEAEAVKLLTVLQSLTLARQRQSQENYSAIPTITYLLKPIWRKYPQLVAAHSCLYCGNSFNVLSKLVAEGENNYSTLQPLGEGHPRLLREINLHHDVDAESTLKIAQLQAELLQAGDASSAEFVGQLLAQGQHYSQLKMWVSNGLNGGRALTKLDLDSLPLDIVIKAWEQGVSSGYDTVQLSQFLVGKGYRPALRWVVWLQSGELPYLQSWSYKREQSKYQLMLKNFTDFPENSGSGLAHYYSQNWKSIYWDNSEKRWRTVR